MALLDPSVLNLYKNSMNKQTHGGKTIHPWLSERTTRVVDKKGLVVALLFLLAVAIWAVDRTEKVSHWQITWQTLPALSDHLDMRMAFTEKGRQFIQSAHFFTEEDVHDQS